MQYIETGKGHTHNPNFKLVVDTFELEDKLNDDYNDRKSASNDLDLKLVINGENIERVESCKYLGIIIDSDILGKNI